LVGAAFPTGDDVPACFDRFVERVRAHGFRFGSELSREAAMILRPASPAHVYLGSGSVVLVGEAAGLISPSSAEGISYAMRSGRVLAGALEMGLDNVAHRYHRMAAPLVADVSARVLKSSAVYTPFIRRILMTTGIGAIRPRGLAALGMHETV
jgi:flavin-dependent dehydrogenase